MPKRQEKKSGDYYRKRIKGPDGKYHAIYGKTIAERDRKVAEQQELWPPRSWPASSSTL